MGQSVRDKLWYLHQINLFADLDEEEFHRLAERTIMRPVKRGQVICHPGERPELVYLIKEGRVKLSRYSPEGREQILGLLEPGNVFGELLLVGERESVHVEAFEDGLICTLPGDDFLELVRAHPEVLMHVIRALGERLRRIEEEIVDLVRAQEFANAQGATNVRFMSPMHAREIRCQRAHSILRTVGGGPICAR